MSNFIDFHILQNVPPSCVNRDDSGSPKTATFGGQRRARVSSQAWKRAVRQLFNDFVDQSELGYRTTRIIDLLAKEISRQNPELESQSAELAKEMFKKTSKAQFNISLKPARSKKDSGGKTANDVASYLVFLSTLQVQQLAEYAIEKAVKNEKQQKKDIEKLLNLNHSIDLALFGRMVADYPGVNVDASCQVAHAISTHSAENEFDFFTAVDDVKSQDQEETDAGAGMMGTVEFNSSTLYRYATINLDMLRENLGSDDATVRAVDAFAQAFVKAMPTGKQNTFANRTLPEAIYVSVRDDQPVSLVNAFENAVTSREGTGFLAPSVSRLVKEAADIEDAYGVKPLAQFTCGVGDSREQLRQIQEPVAFPQLVSDLDNLVTELLAKGE